MGIPFSRSFAAINNLASWVDLARHTGVPATNEIHSPAPRLTRGGGDGWAEQIPLVKRKQKTIPAVIHSQDSSRLLHNCVCTGPSGGDNSPKW